MRNRGGWTDRARAIKGILTVGVALLVGRSVLIEPSSEPLFGFLSTAVFYWVFALVFLASMIVWLIARAAR